MGTAATGTQIRGDGSFTDAILPREHGGAYSSYAYLMNLFGAPVASGGGNGSGGSESLTFAVSRATSVPTGPRSAFTSPIVLGQFVTERRTSSVETPNVTRSMVATRMSRMNRPDRRDSDGKKVSQSTGFHIPTPEDKELIESLWESDGQ